MKVFTTGQVAKICKVAPRTVSKWFDSGRLKGYRIPGSQDRRIPREYLIKFLKEHGMPLGDLEDEAMAKVLIVAQDQVLIENLKRSRALLSKKVRAQNDVFVHFLYKKKSQNRDTFLPFFHFIGGFIKNMCFFFFYKKIKNEIFEKKKKFFSKKSDF